MKRIKKEVATGISNNQKSVVDKLPQLQNLIKRDPTSYHEDFLQQKSNFYSEFDIFKLRPTKNNERFMSLIDFMSHVAPSYKSECSELPIQLLNLLENNASTLHPDVRAKLLQALILLRNRGLLDPLILIKFCFKLYIINDKTLRVALTTYIVNDIKTINTKRTNEKLNKGVQALMHTIMSEYTDITAKKCVDIMTELYRRRIWTDARSVNALATATLSTNVKVSVASLKFFLGIETEMLDDEDEEVKEKDKEASKKNTLHQHSKTTKKRQRATEKVKAHNAKIRKEAREGKVAVPVFPAIQILNDPHSLAEKLFKKLRQGASTSRFEVRLLLMNFISRVIGCHKLQLLTFYPFLQRYLTSHQKDVTIILTYLVQSCHELVPPEELVSIIKSIANNFISDRCPEEVIAIGLNSVRAIIARVPAVLHEPDMDGFIQDLAMYSRKNHKTVMTAANGVVNIVKELYPALLKSKDRGRLNKESLQSMKPMQFGESSGTDQVDGTDLLAAYERGDLELEDDQIKWRKDLVQGDGINDNDDGDNDEDDDEDVEYLTDEEDEEEPTLIAVDKESDVKPLIEWDDDDDDDDDEENSNDGDENQDEECSGGSDNMDEDVDGGSDDDGDSEDNEGDVELDPIERDQRPERKRLLTSDDFDLLNRLKNAYAETKGNAKFKAIGQKIQKARAGGDPDEEDDNGRVQREYALDPMALIPAGRVRRMDKLETLKELKASRADSKWEQGGHRGGLTNLEKERKKNFVMVRKGKRSVSSKLTKSNSHQRYEKMHAREQMGRDKRKRRRT